AWPGRRCARSGSQGHQPWSRAALGPSGGGIVGGVEAPEAIRDAQSGRSRIPLFIDSHDLTGATPEAIADAHLKDLAVQGRYGVRYVKYWMNEARGRVFCLCTAPDAETANRVHRESHG